VLLTNEEIDIPAKVRERCVEIEPPVSMKSIIGEPDREIKSRRKKAEMQHETRPQTPSSATKDFKKIKKKRKIELNHTKVNAFKPCYTHLHFVAKRDEEISQSSVYLQHCVEEYLINTGILTKFKEKVSMFTDGCFKHNKNYETQFWLASKIVNQIPISHHVLAPNEAHNQCDSSAAHAKVAIRKDIAQGAQFESVSNLAFSYSRCTRYFLFEVQLDDFEMPLQIKHDESFLMKCFDFSYEGKKLRTLPSCSHACEDKDRCGHSCCKKKQAECVIVNAVDREGNEKKYFLFEEGETINIQEQAKAAMNELKEDFRTKVDVSRCVPKKNPERVRNMPSKFNDI
jgi:hypothetical protein